MRKIKIGTEKHTQVFATDDPGFNANYDYSVVTTQDPFVVLETVKFQKGAIKEHGVNGVMDEDLIAMVIDRLQSFQYSEFNCRENAIAMTKLEEALLWLGKRTRKRHMI